MSIVLDKEATDALKIIVGRRLRASRKAAQVTEEEAAQASNHKGITQISLMESGDRLPTLITLIRLADRYGSSLDYLAGRVNDPIADPMETSQGALMHSVHSAVKGVVERFGQALSQQASANMLSQHHDHSDLVALLKRVEEVIAAFHRLREINPRLDDEIRGVPRVDAAIKAVADSAARASKRLDREQQARRAIFCESEIAGKDFVLTSPAGAVAG